MNTLGPQLNTDPRFNASTGWSNAGEVWDILGDGAAVQRVTEEAGATLRAFGATQEGERDFLTILHVDEGTSGNVRVYVGNVTGTTRTAPGTYAQIVAATDAGACGLWTNNSGDLRIILLEVFEVVAA
jgi:hypothetical protein